MWLGRWDYPHHCRNLCAQPSTDPLERFSSTFKNVRDTVERAIRAEGIQWLEKNHSLVVHQVFRTNSRWDKSSSGYLNGQVTQKSHCKTLYFLPVPWNHESSWNSNKALDKCGIYYGFLNWMKINISYPLWLKT